MINKLYNRNEITPELLITKGWKSFHPFGHYKENSYENYRLNYLKFLNFKKEINGEIRVIEISGTEIRYYYNINNRQIFYMLNNGIYENKL